MYFSNIKTLLNMRKISLGATVFLLFSCFYGKNDDDGRYYYYPGEPARDQTLLVNLKNVSGENLLDDTTLDLVNNFEIFVKGDGNVINLSEIYTNMGLTEYFNKETEAWENQLVLMYSYYFSEINGKKQGYYIIDYNGLFANDTIFITYKVNDYKVPDEIVEAEINGIKVTLDSVNPNIKKLDIVK